MRTPIPIREYTFVIDVVSFHECKNVSRNETKAMCEVMVQAEQEVLKRERAEITKLTRLKPTMA